jgi:murein L,D-transpeptidase YcbB/YkuD
VGRRRLLVHQAAGNVQIDGIKGKVDLLRFHLMMRGEQGGRVAWVQRRLGAPVTRVFDDETGIRLHAFQRSHGLDADEVIGPATFARLAWLNPTS